METKRKENVRKQIDPRKDILLDPTEDVAEEQTPKDNRNERIEDVDNKKPKVDQAERKVKETDWENALQFRLEFDAVSLILFVIAFLTRTFKLDKPSDIVFDELHYGKYVSLYNKNTFFFDQHPPLGKQLIAAVSGLIGFGNYSFSKIGAPYNDVSRDFQDIIISSLII